MYVHWNRKITLFPKACHESGRNSSIYIRQFFKTPVKLVRVSISIKSISTEDGKLKRRMKRSSSDGIPLKKPLYFSATYKSSEPCLESSKEIKLTVTFYEGNFEPCSGFSTFPTTLRPSFSGNRSQLSQISRRRITINDHFFIVFFLFFTSFFNWR